MTKFRYLLEGIFLTLLLGFSKILPLDWASGFGGFIGRTIGPRLAASRKALRNIEKILPEKTAEQQRAIVKGMWDNLGRTMMEYPHLEKIARERIMLDGTEMLPSHDQSVIIFSGHLANWEALPASLFINKNYETASVYRPPNNPIADKLLQKCRSLKGQIDFYPKSTAGTRQMVSALKNSKKVAMLIDQKYNEGEEIDFMGHPAMSFSAYAVLAQKFDTPLFPIRIERLKGATFHVTLYPEIVTKDKSVTGIMTECHDILGSWIRERPDQWLWLHRRWKLSSRYQKKKIKESENEQ